MKKIIKAKLILLISLLSLITACVIDMPSTVWFSYEESDIDSYTIKITKYIGNSQNVSVPSEINNNPVVEIGSNTFLNCNFISSVDIPSGIKKIGENVFKGCTNLNKIFIPNSVEYIHETAFADWTSDQSIIFDTGINPEVLNKLNTSASIIINNQISSNYIFHYSTQLEGLIIDQYVGNDKNISIPTSINQFSVVGISSSAFSNNLSIEQILIPNSIIQVEEGAFSGWQSNQTIIISCDYTKWNSNWNENCSATINYKKHIIKFIGIDKADIIIDNGEIFTIPIFSNQDLIVKEITDNYGRTWQPGESFYVYQDLILTWDWTEKQSIEDYDIIQSNSGIKIIKYKGKNTTLRIPTTLSNQAVTQIGNDAFSNCNFIESIIIPDCIEYIGSNAFSNWSSDQIITITENTDMSKWNIDWDNNCKATIRALNKDYNILINKKTVTITSYKSPNQKVIIPNTINELPVTKIGEKAFSNNSYITDVIISDNILSIKDYAFYDNKQLESIIFPNSLKDIGYMAFSYCKNLKNISLPQGLKSIGDFCFSYCTSIDSIILYNSIEKIGDQAFKSWKSNQSIYCQNDCKFKQWHRNCFANTSAYIGRNFYPEYNFSIVLRDEGWEISNILPKDGHYIIPETISEIPVTILGPNAIHDNSILGYTVPRHITKICSEALNCPNLQYLCIHQNTNYVGEYPIANGKKNILIEKGTNISTWKLNTNYHNISYYIPGLEFAYDERDNFIEIKGYMGNSLNIAFPDSIDSKPVKQIDPYWFGKQQIESLTIPESIEIIGDRTFSNCNNLKSITIPNTIKTIGSSAFEYCSELKEIILPKSITDMGAFVFQNCNKLQTIYICADTNTTKWHKYWNNGITANIIYNYLPGSDFLIENVRDGVKIKGYIGNNSNIIVPENLNDNKVIILGEKAFANLDSTSISIPNTVKTIESNCFENSTSIKEIDIPSSVSYIAPYAFRNWTSKQRIIVGDATDNSNWNSLWNYGSNAKIDIAQYTITFTGINKNSITLPKGTKYEIPHYSKDGFHIERIVEQNKSVLKTGDIICIMEDTNLNWIWEKGSPSECFKYTISDGKVIIKNYIGNEINVCIPAKINNIPVMELGDYAFSNCTNIQSIDIPRSVTTIGSYCFSKCKNIKQLNIHNTVTYVGVAAFEFFNENQLITIEAGTYTGSWALDYGVIVLWNKNCYAPFIHDYFENTNFSAINYNEGFKIIDYIGSDRTLVIPDTLNGKPVLSISTGVLSNTNLQSIVIPHTVNEMPAGAFSDWTKDQTIMIQNSKEFVDSHWAYHWNYCDKGRYGWDMIPTKIVYDYQP